MLEELGSDTHVIFPIDAPRVEAEELRAAADDEDEAPDRRRPRASGTRACRREDGAPGRASGFGWRSTRTRFYFFDPETGASLTAGAPAAAAVG